MILKKKVENCLMYLQAVPYFIALIIMEWAVLYIKGETLPRLNDSFSSLSNGVLSLLHG
jgi:hypothetical protein